MLKSVIIILLVIVSFNLSAQTWEIGGAVGGAGYMGDFNETNPLKISGGSAGGFVKRNFNGYLSAKLSYTIGTISGADSTSANQQLRNRNLSFSTLLSEASVVGEFNLMHYIPDAGKNKFTPYLYLGVAWLNYFPSAVYKGQTYLLRGMKTEGESKPYATAAFSVPYGLGIKYNIGGKWTIGADIGYRTPNTNYLDDVSGLYPPKSKSALLTDRSGETTGIYTGTPGSQRGNLNGHDTYFFSQITFSFTFVTQKCYFQ